MIEYGQFGLDWRNRLPVAGAQVYLIPPPPILPENVQRQGGLLDFYSSPFLFLNGNVIIAKEWPPNARFPIVTPPWVPPLTITAPPVPPPQQFTTKDGTLQGVVDGVNRTFTLSVFLHRARVYVNGVGQTLNVDCQCGPYCVIFMPQSTPAAGSIVTVEGWSNW